MSTPKVKHSLAASVGSQRSPPREVSEAELRSLLGTPIVQTVLAMGVDLSRVKQALKYQIRNTGQPFDTVDSLLEAAIEFQHYNEHRQSLENGNYEDVEWPSATPLPSVSRRSSSAENIREENLISLSTSDSRRRVTNEDAPLASQIRSETPALREAAIPKMPESSEKVTGNLCTSEMSAQLGSQCTATDRTQILEEEIRRLKEARLCKVCLDEEVSIAYIPCGHIVTCVQCAADLLSGKEASTSSGPAGSLQVEEKRRRAWEQWSADDIAAFFEGLNEFGKDFDAIQNCLYTKNRKKSLVNSTNIKNKDQVRHFYYRTWHKISKYLLPTPDEGKRMHKELYGLINYGEMWKKLGGYFNDRCGEKLNELVQHGVTSVKIKGKSYRIKTPVCPALKRLQSTGTETQKLPSTPERIVIELTPCCNADFLRVQSVAHNPRIRISTDSSSPLSTIISFLTKKWKPRSILEAESVAEDELIMRVTPEMKQVAPIGSTKKGRKRTFSGQEQMDETEVKLEVKSWILETSDQVTFSRMRQRLRRPLRYGTSLKRGSLAATLNKMPGPSPIQARPHPSSLMAQSTTVNITWPPEENGNGTGSFVLQVQLDGQQQQTSPQKDIPTASVSGPLYLSPKKGPDIQNGTVCTVGKVQPVFSSFTRLTVILQRSWRKDARSLRLPPIYEIFPGKFFGKKKKLVVENKLSYFREDLGINSHHWHWHLIFPVEATGEIINPPDRRGELFYYMHQQILAR
uniref:EOG090X01XB n=1 Tax=Daphnia similis TaxID=35528 RepID=A0A4Y7N0U4_9CRUS|nr:EOG090X01XB [Daphnia similis]